MSDLPIEEKKEVPLSLEERVSRTEQDIQELARGVNVHATLLETIIVAFDRVVQKYLSLMRTPVEGEPNGEKPKE